MTPDFTPIASTIGGTLIGSGAAMLLLFDGRIAGISGIVGGIVRPGDRADISWRVFFVGGLLLGSIALAIVEPSALSMSGHRSIVVTSIAGLLVGFGTRLGSGCTSGHGVCGVSMLSKRSFIATFTFMATGFLSTFVLEHVLRSVR
jgi:uncharacterized membrane protein YedE/YeeE